MLYITALEEVSTEAQRDALEANGYTVATLVETVCPELIGKPVDEYIEQDELLSVLDGLLLSVDIY
jgi:hypothetical protein